MLPQSSEILETVVRDISIVEIDPNTAQPRRDFDKEALERLAESIRQAGVLSPILVIEQGSRFRIVAGERRFRAARIAGLETVPCIVRSMTDAQQMEAALIENLQREDLNPIEEAMAIRSLMQECGYTQEEASKKLGKSRPAIANSLRLLTLPDQVTSMVTGGDISAGHARVLAGVSPESRQLELARQCVLHDYSVRKLEEVSHKQFSGKAASSGGSVRGLSPELFTLQNTLREALGMKTTLTGNEKKGKILLTYNSAEELEYLFEVMGRLIDG